MFIPLKPLANFYKHINLRVWKYTVARSFSQIRVFVLFRTENLSFRITDDILHGVL